MKHILITTITAVVLVGCEKSQEVKDLQLKLAARAWKFRRY